MPNVFSLQARRRVAVLTALTDVTYLGDSKGGQMFLDSPHPDLDGKSPVAAAQSSDIGAQNALALLASRRPDAAF